MGWASSNLYNPPFKEDAESYYHIRIHNRGNADLLYETHYTATGFQHVAWIAVFAGKVSPGIVQEVRKRITIYPGTTGLKWRVFLDGRLIPEQTDPEAPPEASTDPFEYRKTFKEKPEDASSITISCSVFPGNELGSSECKLEGWYEDAYVGSDWLVGCHSRDDSDTAIDNSGVRWSGRFSGFPPNQTVVLNSGRERILASYNAVALKCAVRVNDVWWREVAE